ncbi:MAG: methylated-DNA--[protein]-cysteine S-methyltransferase [Desulfoprunum sp.]|nr:methylated-DNA--[protein]-cysteine S-methyltransferase [Desulfoprunum sp.]
MDEFSEQSARYRRIERALSFIESNFRTQPDLDEIARSVHLSRFHFDRLFKDWVGITPLQFLHYLTLDYAKKQLLEAQSVLDAAIDAGLSGPGRLHDLFVTFEGMSPGEFKKSGAGLAVGYGLHPTPFGTCLLARTDRGICHLSFPGPTEDDQVFALQQLSDAWPQAHLREDRENTGPLVEQIFSQATGNSTCRFHLLLKGTNFQINVWKALLAIPAGHLISYQDLAATLGQPKACRAVAGAVAANQLAYLIPCHRVILGSGRIRQYRWGSTRKKALIGWEAAIRQVESPTADHLLFDTTSK